MERVGNLERKKASPVQMEKEEGSSHWTRDIGASKSEAQTDVRAWNGEEWQVDEWRKEYGCTDSPPGWTKTWTGPRMPNDVKEWQIREAKQGKEWQYFVCRDTTQVYREHRKGNRVFD